MNKELVIQKVICQKCGGSRWKTLEKGKRVQCRLCDTEADYIKVEPVIKVKVPEPVKVAEANTTASNTTAEVATIEVATTEKVILTEADATDATDTVKV